MFKGFHEKEFLEILNKAAKKLPEFKKKGALTANLTFLIQKEWPKITTPVLAEHTLPFKIAKEKLVIRADHGIYAQEIMLHSREIIAKMNRMIPHSPGRIEVKVGPLYEKSGKTKDIMSPKERLTVHPENKNIHPNSKLLEHLISLLKNE